MARKKYVVSKNSPNFAKLQRRPEDHEAKEIYLELEKIRKREGGKLPPQSVVDVAQDIPILSGFFEWDDEKAGHLHRLEQARALIRSVEIKTTNGTITQKKAYVKVSTGDRRPGYNNRAEILTDEEARARLVNKGNAELRTWLDRYEDLKALYPIVKSVRLWLKDK